MESQAAQELVVGTDVVGQFGAVLRLRHGDSDALAGAGVAGVGEDWHPGQEVLDGLQQVLAGGGDVADASRGYRQDPHRDSVPADQGLDVAAEVVLFPYAATWPGRRSVPSGQHPIYRASLASERHFGV